MVATPLTRIVIAVRSAVSAVVPPFIKVFIPPFPALPQATPPIVFRAFPAIPFLPEIIYWAIKVAFDPAPASDKLNDVWENVSVIAAAVTEL